MRLLKKWRYFLLPTKTMKGWSSCANLGGLLLLLKSSYAGQQSKGALQ